jgi:hypothetical protein
MEQESLGGTSDQTVPVAILYPLLNGRGPRGDGVKHGRVQALAFPVATCAFKSSRPRSLSA